MNTLHWFLLIVSAFLYVIPFIYITVWWLIFIFPVPLLYLSCMHNLSFTHGFIWGFIVFILHLHKGIFIIMHLAGDCAVGGFFIGILTVTYQALCVGIIFYCISLIIKHFFIKSHFFRIIVWVLGLFLLIVWIDQYCLWIFDTIEGYPLMHPLILMQHSSMFFLLPMIGKQLTTVLFLCMPASLVLLVLYKNKKTTFFCICLCCVWLLSWVKGYQKEQLLSWYSIIQSLPYMIHSTGKDSQIAMKVIARHIRNLLDDYPETRIIIMPESALNIMNVEEKSELLALWNDTYLGRRMHIIFGACRLKNGNYYNSFYWVYNGVLQGYYDKKHAMMITERLVGWMNYDYVGNIYFKDGIFITRAGNERILLNISDEIAFVPYICSEFFFTEYPDDCYKDVPIIVMVNDTLLAGSYLQTLLLLLARFKAIQWQREVVYVSYSRSVIIDKQGRIVEMNE